MAKHSQDYYMRLAIDAAVKGVDSNAGGPFGAVIVKDGEVLSVCSNSVTSTNDPTAHAEVVAIREACQRLSTYDLSGAEIYATCEPCPMCLAAIYWAGITKIYYCGDRDDAHKAGFSDKFIYDEISLPLSVRSIKMARVEGCDSNILFDMWSAKLDKLLY